VRGYEGGTVLDAVPARTVTGLHTGGRGDAVTLWPAGRALPTADHPVLAMVLTPVAGNSGAATAPGGGPAPTWVFPFDRPLPPGAGDNQALAVNTTDGSVRYAVSFSLVWADGDTALQRNEAYALASCSGCATVAVAFQVVLVLGSVHVVAPQDLAAAVNDGCVSCLTYALAEQQVLSVPGELGPQDSQDLAAVWASLTAFGRDLQDVPLAEIQSRLQDYEQQISAIVRRTAPPAAAPTSGADPSATPTGTGAATATTTAGTTARSSGSASATATSGWSGTRSAGTTTSAEPTATSAATPTGDAATTSGAAATGGSAGATG
jgi:putative peptide zinc metalloprotease protein